jgi:hypothetical protein
MEKRNRLELYYTLFSLLVENPWTTPRMMAEYFDHTGRGRSPSTFLRHLTNMYEKGISREPRLTVKPFEKCQTITYFCRKKSNRGLATTLSSLSGDRDITYAILLSGSDFFLTSREKDLNTEKYGLEVYEQSKLYTPTYTIPKGWNTPMDKALNSLLQVGLRKGLIPRTVERDFSWSELDWKVFDIMSESVRTKIPYLARKTGVDYKTAKRHFFGVVLPACVVAHYFYPRGYDFYLQSFVRMRSKYETELVKVLEQLPCTTYVFPLENELILNLFHENQRKIIALLEKMEEKTIIDGFLLYAPLYHVYPDIRTSEGST